MCKKRLSRAFLASTFYPITSVLTLALLTPDAVLASNLKESSSIHALAFQEVVSGTIKGATGPLAAVTISVKEDPKIISSTDENGAFSINAKVGQTLIISAVGYEKVERKIESNNMNIDLEESVNSLDEVVVVGYGIQQKKESLTGALQNVSGQKLRDVTTPSVENMLNGKAAGVYVAPSTGRPGTRGAVVIRGQASVNGVTSPLWVIDGVIVGYSPGDLNPDDIANLTVLKDAASTSLYGSQGANGVVVVTTKAPRSQKMQLSYSTKLGFNQLTNGNMQMMNGAELYDYFASFQNASDIKFPRWNEELRNSNFDWWDVATRNGFTQNHNISLQGGNETLQSYLSLGYYNELGAVKGFDYDRYNIRLNTVYKPFEWLSIKPSIVAARRGTDDRQYSTGAMVTNLPWDNPYDADGNLVPHRYSGWVNNASTNYLYDLQWNKSATTNYELQGNFDFDIRLTDWLTFASVNSYRTNLYSSSGYTDPRSNGGESVLGRITEYRLDNTRRYTNQLLRFNKTWDKHAVNGIVAYEFNDFNEKIIDIYGTGFLPGFEVLDVVAKPERTKGSINEWATQSYLANANYAYDNRYLAQASFRRDGASNFGTDVKYGNFFSISGAWNIHNESWFNVDKINNLKLRAAYGSVGNKPTSLYPQYDLYAITSQSGYNGTPGALINQIGNPNLQWENTYTAGVGVDAGFFNNRLRLTADYYNKTTDNVLFQVPVTGLIGVTSIWRNVGEMQNRGYELTLGGDIIKKGDWLWSMDLNLGHNKNKLTDLYKTLQNGELISKPIIAGDNSGIAGSAQRLLEIGAPVDTYYMIEWAGVNPDNGKPMWYKDDLDAEGNVIGKSKTEKYAEGTYRKMGKAAADLFGGFGTFVAYKDFDLTANFGFSIGGQKYNYARQELDADGAYVDRNQMKLQDGWSRWEKPGDVATHPVARYNNSNNGNKASSRYLESNDFLRLRSLAVGYSFKLPQYYLSNVRVFLSGENLFTWTDYSGVDPEATINPDNGKLLETALPAVYPATRKFMFGLNVTF